MPAEKALKEARTQVGPGFGSGGGSDAFRARLEESAAFLAPLALILAIALAGGGFDLGERHVAGLAVWLLVVVLLALGAAGRAVIGRPFLWTSGLLVGLVSFSAISSLWSGSVELSVTEADRVLVYLGVFIAAFLVAQTDQRRQRFAEGLAFGLIGLALLGIASRLLPDLISVANGLGSGARLRYPLDYWNANAAAFGIAAALALWLSRESGAVALRWIAAGSLPTVLLALYLTYSRGGLVTLVVACGLLAILSRDRLWLLVTLAIGALGALPAVLAVQDQRLIADNVASADTAGQGVTVLLVLIAGTLLSLALFAAVSSFERRGGALATRAVALSRNRRVLAWIAIGASLLAIAAAIAVGGRAWDQFSEPDLQVAQPEDRSLSFSGTGRRDFWEVAVEAFGEAPVGGHGAGTYQFSWNLLRDFPKATTEAHSLYLEAFAELGLIGGLLVLGTVGAVLWTGFGAWRAASGRRRELYAALLAAATAFAVAAAFDWFWEVAGLAVVFFLAGGCLVAGRCAQLAEARAAGNGRNAAKGGQSRFGLTLAGLALAWVAALALLGPLLVDHQLSASRAAAAEGDLQEAVSKADTARSIEPWAASPYVQLALLAQGQDEFDLARERITEAIDREDRNWLLYYLRARIEREAGNPEAGFEDIEEALRLNPQERCLQQGLEGCG